MSNRKIHSHPSIAYSEELRTICQPLETWQNIDYFVHVKVDKAGNFSALGKRPDFVEHYLRSKYYNHDIHLSQSDCKLEYIIHDNIGHHGKTQQLVEDCKQFNLNHIFTIMHRGDGFVDAYHFATSKKNNLINEIYLRSLPVLQQFISYFTEQVNTSKQLRSAYDYKYRIDNQEACHESNIQNLTINNEIQAILKSMIVKRYLVLNEDKSYITKREMECLLWLHHGKTFEEIAKILLITERTVRAHINSVKEKLKCQTMFQLGEKINQFKLIEPSLFKKW